jgi:transposase
MPSIIKKKIKNNTYYYYAESRRVNGKPRYVNQKYLGTAESIFEKISRAATLREPLYAVVLDFADVILMYDISIRLNIVNIINEHAKKRNQGTTVGEYALVAAINRAVAPTSKNCISYWFSQTALSRLLPFNENALTPQNYWNHMYITDNVISDIEDELVKKIVDTYQIDTSHLIYDATNLYTYIDTAQESVLAKRGHSKEKRNDLKIVGLSMMITPDCRIPLLYDTYPGNTPDSKQFSTMLDKLKLRYEKLACCDTDITIVFDRGNNAQDNIEQLESEQFPLYYVGGLKRNQCEELFAVTLDKFIPLAGEKFKKTSVFRTTKNVYKRDMTIVIAYNQNLYDGQMQGILNNIDKTAISLHEIQTRLLKRAEGVVKKGRAPTAINIDKQVRAILATEFMEDIFEYELTSYKSIPFLKYSLNFSSLDKIKTTILGNLRVQSSHVESSTILKTVAFMSI